MGFKPHKEYRRVPKKPTANSIGNKNKGVEPTIKVSNSNLFEVLNLVDNDEELGNNRGATNLINNRATSSGSSFMNVNNSSTDTTLIIDKIRNFEELLTSGQAILVDEIGNLLKKRDSYGNGDYDDDLYDDDMYEDIINVKKNCRRDPVCSDDVTVLQSGRDGGVARRISVDMTVGLCWLSWEVGVEEERNK
ncbi:hypothetical protein Tco_1131644 [Tanacetum coccineum]